MTHNRSAAASTATSATSNGIVEVKCPQLLTHLDYWRAGRLPRGLSRAAHAQPVGHGRAWCDFVPYDDRLPTLLGFFCIRIHRDALDIAGYERQVDRFLAEVDHGASKIEKLEKLKGEDGKWYPRHRTTAPPAIPYAGRNRD